jgi:hydrogenase nickel incorporation protein HypA/HybF
VHELSIALSIVDISEDEVKKAGGIKVEKVVLEIGQLAGVEIESLRFAWSEAVKNSVLENADCFIEEKRALAKCLNCKNEFNVSHIYEPCPHCDDFKTELIQGKEIKIKSLLIL